MIQNPVRPVGSGDAENLCHPLGHYVHIGDVASSADVVSEPHYQLLVELPGLNESQLLQTGRLAGIGRAGLNRTVGTLRLLLCALCFCRSILNGFHAQGGLLSCRCRWREFHVHNFLRSELCLRTFHRDPLKEC